MFTIQSAFSTYLRSSLTALLLISSILYFSCNKHPVPPEGQLAENENPQQRMLPKKIASGQNSITFSYKDQSDMVEEINHSGGDQQKLTYTAKGRLSMLEKIRSNIVYEYIDYTADSKDVINGAKRYVGDGGAYNVKEVMKFSYDNKERLQFIERYTKANIFISSEERAYSASGNLLNVRHKTAGGQQSEQQYTFDEKQGCFKNVAFGDFIAMESDMEVMYNRMNNRLTGISNGTAATKYSCQYNSNGYPTVITENGNTSRTFRITYT